MSIICIGLSSISTIVFSKEYSSEIKDYCNKIINNLLPFGHHFAARRRRWLGARRLALRGSAVSGRRAESFGGLSAAPARPAKGQKAPGKGLGVRDVPEIGTSRAKKP